MPSSPSLRQGVLDDALTVTISVKGAGKFVSGARPTTVTFDAGNATADPDRGHR